jgi:hypothetical protein
MRSRLTNHYSSTGVTVGKELGYQCTTRCQLGRRTSIAVPRELLIRVFRPNRRHEETGQKAVHFPGEPPNSATYLRPPLLRTTVCNTAGASTLSQNSTVVSSTARGRVRIYETKVSHVMTSLRGGVHQRTNLCPLNVMDVSLVGDGADSSVPEQCTV